jgi:hypothetical protein
MKKIIMTALVLIGLSGCATVTLPPERWNRLASTLQDARRLGAGRNTVAQLYLKLAEDERRAAQQLAMDGDERANLMLARAQSDASLAASLAHEAQVHESMQRADAQLRTVQDQMQSESGSTP